MSSTIYGGKTKNDVIIQDMVDDNRDIVYRDDRFPNHFARFGQSILDEDDTEFKTAGPAIAIFEDAEPFEPIWGVRLSGSFSDYTNGWDMTELFRNRLKDIWDDFATSANA